jgi:Polysaccharide lyase family 4, domain III/Polysaccharide lyase family 4, domain II
MSSSASPEPGRLGRRQFRTGAAASGVALGLAGDFASPVMKPGSYTQTLYQGELAVATTTVTVTAGTETTGQNIDSAWVTPASPVFRIGTWDGTLSGFLNWANLTWMHPSDARMASWGPVTYTVGSSSAADFPAYQFKDVNNPTTVNFTLSSSQVAARIVRIGITAAYAGAGRRSREQLDVGGAVPVQPAVLAQPDHRHLPGQQHAVHLLGAGQRVGGRQQHDDDHHDQRVQRAERLAQPGRQLRLRRDVLTLRRFPAGPPVGAVHFISAVRYATPAPKKEPR